jgi:hypothetical protein
LLQKCANKQRAMVVGTSPAGEEDGVNPTRGYDLS